jgi:hypothetical protein
MSFNPLHDDAYVELSTGLLASTSLAISVTTLAVADTLSEKVQTVQSANKPTAKRQRLQIIHHNTYREIEAKIPTVMRYTHRAVVLVLIDSTLQTRRATKIANATVDLTINQKPTAKSRAPDASEIILTSPPIKQESPPKPADASTLAKAAINPPAPLHTYKWYPKPTAKINTHIHDDSFLKSISTEYSGATTNITLTCTYDNNPQATLTAALHLLGTTLLMDVLQPMFQNNLTKSEKNCQLS